MSQVTQVNFHVLNCHPYYPHMDYKPPAHFSYKRIDTNMLSANINHVDRITQADIRMLDVTSEKDERKTQNLFFEEETNTKPDNISINLNLNITLCWGISFNFTVILSVTSVDTFIKLLAIMQMTLTLKNLGIREAQQMRQ